MAERANRASRHPAAAGRWKTAAGSRAEHGGAADVEFDVVFTRAVTRAVREVCRRFWLGPRSRGRVGRRYANSADIHVACVFNEWQDTMVEDGTACTSETIGQAEDVTDQWARPGDQQYVLMSQIN